MSLPVLLHKSWFELNIPCTSILAFNAVNKCIVLTFRETIESDHRCRPRIRFQTYSAIFVFFHVYWVFTEHLLLTIGVLEWVFFVACMLPVSHFCNSATIYRCPYLLIYLLIIRRYHLYLRSSACLDCGKGSEWVHKR